MTKTITHTTKEIVIPYDTSASMCNIRIYVDGEGTLCMEVDDPRYGYWLSAVPVHGQMTDEERAASNFYYEMRSRKAEKRLDSGRFFKYLWLRSKRRFTKRNNTRRN